MQEICAMQDGKFVLDQLDGLVFVLIRKMGALGTIAYSWSILAWLAYQ
jgi:hypothetical protein